MKIIGLSGSIRKNSYNTMLLNYMKERYADKMDLEILSIKDLPHFNQDDELDPPLTVKVFKKAITEADGVIIATPEYNWSVPGVLKNAIDWTSRVDHVLKDKPVMIVGASTGKLGTIRAQIDLRKILSSAGVAARPLPPSRNEFLVTAAHEKFDENGSLTDEPTVKFLDQVINNFLEFI